MSTKIQVLMEVVKQRGKKIHAAINTIRTSFSSRQKVTGAPRLWWLVKVKDQHIGKEIYMLYYAHTHIYAVLLCCQVFFY